MNRTKLQKVAELRVREAQALLQAGCAPGAYYLSGYIIECALKACIAKQTRKYDFPNRKLINTVHTHDLERLMYSAGLEEEFQRACVGNEYLGRNWGIITNWSESSRYDASIITERSELMLSACVSREDGVFPWIKLQW